MIPGIGDGESGIAGSPAPLVPRSPHPPFPQPLIPHSPAPKKIADWLKNGLDKGPRIWYTSVHVSGTHKGRPCARYPQGPVAGKNPAPGPLTFLGPADALAGGLG